jgi:anti-sigma regulatory factor (Ser/Thr protein kinase)
MPPFMVWRFPARPEQVWLARHAVTEWGKAHGVADADALALAVSEAVTNVILHAYVDQDQPGDVEVIAERHPDDGLEVRVCDEGRGMRPRPDSSGIGAGLPIIANLTERLDVETRSGGGTRLRMIFDAVPV